MKSFFNTIILTAMLTILTACATIKPVPVETIIQYQTRDSLVLRDSTILIPKERIVDVVPAYDSLRLETSMAFAQAWVDTTTHTLKGKIENKQGTQYKYIYKDRFVTKDSLVYKEVPVPVEVIKTVHPKYEVWLWWWFALTIAAIAILIYFKFR